jgi:hypothetical protein
MIKCMMLVYRAPHLTPEQFFDYWQRIHARLAIESAPVMRMRRYAQIHRRDHAVALGFQQSRGCRLGDFDGIAEAWWDGFDDMAAAAGSMPIEVATAILQDEAQFVDLKRSVIWFGEEKLLLGA